MSDWNWTQATYEEFEKRRKNETYFKIYQSSNKKNTLYKFWAKNRDEAYNILLKYKEEHPDMDNLYYDTTGYYGIAGKKVMYDGLREMIEDRVVKKNIFHKIWHYIYVNTIEPLKHFKYFCQELKYYIKNKHMLSESWDLSSHILDDILYNIPLIQESLIIPNNYLEHDDETEALKKFHDDLNKLMKDIRLYQYYSDYGIVDENDAEMVKIDREYKNTLKYIKGTEHLDYIDADDKARNQWKLIWEQWQKLGQSCWT